MLVGGLFFWLYYLKRQEANYARLSIYLATGFYFLAYGLLFDAYRIKALRPLLLSVAFSFKPYQTIILLISLLPLYSVLIESILRILSKRFSNH